MCLLSRPRRAGVPVLCGGGGFAGPRCGTSITILRRGFIKPPLAAGREAKLPWLMESDDAVNKMLRAIGKRKKSYAFPWQLASIVRLGMVMPNFIYDWISRRNSFRE